MRIPVLDKQGKTVTHIEADDYKGCGVVFLGSGLARRTFVRKENDFLEVVTADLIVTHDEDEEEDLDDEEVLLINLPPGQIVRVCPNGTDGAFTIAYDMDEEGGLLSVHSSLPGNVMGDAGTIFAHDFDDEMDEHEGPCENCEKRKAAAQKLTN